MKCLCNVIYLFLVCVQEYHAHTHTHMHAHTLILQYTVMNFHRKTRSIIWRITTSYCLTVTATYTELRYHTHGLPHILTQITSVCSVAGYPTGNTGRNSRTIIALHILISIVSANMLGTVLC